MRVTWASKRMIYIATYTCMMANIIRDGLPGAHQPIIFLVS